MAENEQENEASRKNSTTRKRERENKRTKIVESQMIWIKLEIELRGKQEKEFPKRRRKEENFRKIGRRRRTRVQSNYEKERESKGQ